MIYVSQMGISNLEVFEKNSQTPTCVTVSVDVTTALGARDIAQHTFHFEAEEMSDRFRKALLDGGFKEHGQNIPLF